MDNDRTPSDVVAARVRQVRHRREMTVADLSARCAELGAPALTAQALYKLEGQRGSASRRPRPVTVDELLILSAALNVAPVHLLVPPDDFRKTYRLTGGISEQSARVREWIRGVLPLPLNADPREYFSEVPRTEHELQHQAVSIPLPPDWQAEEGVSDGEH